MKKATRERIAEIERSLRESTGTYGLRDLQDAMATIVAAVLEE